jgi:hypothetical protein
VPGHPSLAQVAARGALGVHVPDPIVSRENGIDPAHEALVADSVGLAPLVVRSAGSRRATRVRAARHVRRALRGDRSHRETLPIRGRQLAGRARRRVQAAAKAPDSKVSNEGYS